MALGTNLSYTYNGIVTTDVILKPTLKHPPTQLFFPNYMPNVQSSWQIGLIGNLNGVVRSYSGCGRNDYGKSLNIFNRTLNTTRLEITWDQCPADFDQTVYEMWQKTGNDINDLTGTDLETIINDLLIDAGKRDIFRLATMGDTSGGNAENNSIDGLWKLAMDAVASYCVTKVANLGSSTTFSAGDGLGMLQEIYNKAPRLLKQLPPNEKIIAVTEDIFENVWASYESTSSGSDLQFQALKQGPDMEDGTPSLMFRGVRVVCVYAWSQAIADYSLSNPNRIMYFAPANNWIGAERRNITDISTDVWYSRDDDKNYFRTRFKLGVQFAHCDLMAVSY